MASCTTVLTIVNPEPRIRSVSPSHNSLVSLLPPKPSHSYSTIQNVIIHYLVITAVKCKQPHQSINLRHEKNEKKVIFFDQGVNKLSFVNYYYFFIFVVKQIHVEACTCTMDKIIRYIFPHV